MSSNTAEYYAKKRLECWGMPVPEGLSHGPASWAGRVYGCNCKLCLPSGRRVRQIADGRPLTGRERRRRSKSNLRGKPVPPGVKHGVYTYNVYGCRCDACRAASSSDRNRRRNHWREKAYGVWSGNAKVTVVHWPPVDAGPTWTCPDCKEVIHR